MKTSEPILSQAIKLVLQIKILESIWIFLQSNHMKSISLKLNVKYEAIVPLIIVSETRLVKSATTLI